MLRGNEHGQVGLAAGGGEGGSQVTHLALGILHAQDQHVLSHPALIFAQIGGDTQGKALLAQQYVAAVTRVDGHYGVVLGEVDDVAVLRIVVCSGVEALDEIILQPAGRIPAHSGHDGHIEHHVYRVGQLNTVLGEGRANHAHGVGNDVHGAALHGSGIQPPQPGVHFLRGHPVVGGTGVLLFPAADEGSALNTSHIVGSGAVKIAAGQLFLIQLLQLTSGAGLGPQLLHLGVASVDPYDMFRLRHGGHFVDPVQYSLIVCQCQFDSLLLISENSERKMAVTEQRSNSHFPFIRRCE